ncbi:MAG: hypothetical protein WC829_05780 [Hyphomicrobium sp.]|jgi:hypothetical protein
MPTTNFPGGLTIWGTPGVPLLPNPSASYFGNVWFVDTVNGSDGNDGKGPNTAFRTMGRALWFDTIAAGAGTQANVGPNDTIYFVGTVREQLIAPLTKVVNGVATAVTGVQIVGMAQGGVRDDGGAKWTYPASGAVAGMALLSLRQQGWATYGFLMTPEPTSGAAIVLNRQENATYPDSSHFIADSMRFVGIDVTTTYGIRDIGGCSNVLVQNCEFYLLTTGYYCSSTAIAVPLRNRFIGNRFLQNTNDFIAPMSYGIIEQNRFFSSAATTKINNSGGGFCVVTGNIFPDAALDIDPAHGYDGNATDSWTGNLVPNQAAFVFGDPA